MNSNLLQSSNPVSRNAQPKTLERASVWSRYRKVRALTESLARPLSDEDQCVQAMADASPTKWHLGHTSWFFETVVLRQFWPELPVYDEQFLYLFNSYYESLGPRQPRPQRGLITRPSVAQVNAYRTYVDEHIHEFVHRCDASLWPQALQAIELGLNHEQQHQELILTDVKYLLHQNPFATVYCPEGEPFVFSPQPTSAVKPEWLHFAGGLHAIGHDVAHEGSNFCYDNETPRHSVYVYPFELANRLVTCGEYLAFIEDGGYQNPSHWLSEGWSAVQAGNWLAPLYWKQNTEGHWRVFTLHGEQPLDLNQPVAHVSYFEAAAFASWANARLPREAELEVAFGEEEGGKATGLQQAFGACWQWTCSSYDAYPGFKPFEGAVAEYNGKFMVGQLVLKGSSCVTPEGHSRASYRNFFPPSARWQFSGIRLARDL
ncbi:MAG: ergothioneine biosynthesis protein EgtB [Limnobacter sp.]|uniref:ergothioneine biosynthesis protein EgtB n=1 Tax=Limnobacter sp. TaxID=2003368 RepID=UPI0022C165EA|nr:ergothioneine biosynthesis protein EgtB [Limnobacter sp.]MCZ8014410.1 ergothioneine biosynthesis protein EgtB [Limnobacter sp.]